MGKTTLSVSEKTCLRLMLCFCSFFCFSFCCCFCCHSHFHLFPLNDNIIVPNGCPMITLVTYYIQWIIDPMETISFGQRHTTCLQHHKHHIYTYSNYYFRCIIKTNILAKRERKTLTTIFYLLWHLSCAAFLLLCFWRRKKTTYILVCAWVHFILYSMRVNWTRTD